MDAASVVGQFVGEPKQCGKDAGVNLLPKKGVGFSEFPDRIPIPVATSAVRSGNVANHRLFSLIFAEQSAYLCHDGSGFKFMLMAAKTVPDIV